MDVLGYACFCILEGQIKNAFWRRGCCLAVSSLRNGVLNEGLDETGVNFALVREDGGMDIVVVIEIGHNELD